MTSVRIHFHFHPGNSGARTKRVSVLIGNHGFLAVADLMAVKDLIYEDICKGFLDDENNVWL